MKSRFPQFKAVRRSDTEIEFIGDLQVKHSFPVYTVSATYRGILSPQVRIIKPELVEKPKHFYRESKTLCLYHPSKFDWKRESLMAVTILPWTAAWIYFYEVWLKEGIWYGPEVDHNDPEILRTQPD